ncbi:MAG: hypothetical protein K8I29_07215 [Alphaproteobacteria bacterium]|uniref:Uncharacterized protein n=1 Tax=Candidatus Nitrobium versatile TaxID=2884831 RepID=A0A953JE03_9BACT|nr:hypothetical protein [Candidatus Nitrobium versatile]
MKTMSDYRSVEVLFPIIAALLVFVSMTSADAQQKLPDADIRFAVQNELIVIPRFRHTT